MFRNVSDAKTATINRQPTKSTNFRMHPLGFNAVAPQGLVDRVAVGNLCVRRRFTVWFALLVLRSGLSHPWASSSLVHTDCLFTRLTALVSSCTRALTVARTRLACCLALVRYSLVSEWVMELILSRRAPLRRPLVFPYLFVLYSLAEIGVLIISVSAVSRWIRCWTHSTNSLRIDIGFASQYGAQTICCLSDSVHWHWLETVQCDTVKPVARISDRRQLEQIDEPSEAETRCI